MRITGIRFTAGNTMTYDYGARNIDGEKVRTYDYLKPGYNLVICLDTWCRPCP